MANFKIEPQPANAKGISLEGLRAFYDHMEAILLEKWATMDGVEAALDLGFLRGRTEGAKDGVFMVAHRALEAGLSMEVVTKITLTEESAILDYIGSMEAQSVKGN